MYRTFWGKSKSNHNVIKKIERPNWKSLSHEQKYILMLQIKIKR